MRSSRSACVRRRHLAERSIGLAWVPIVVMVGAGVRAGLGIVVVVDCLQVDDDPFLSPAWVRILLSTHLSRMIYWSNSSGMSRVIRVSLILDLSPS